MTTTEANIRVFPTTAGIISELFVTDGEIVSKGQALARISTSLSTSTDALQSVQTEILESLNSEASSLRSQIDRVRAIATSEERALKLEIDNTLFRIGAMKQQIADASERMQLAEKNESRMLDLRARKLVSETDMDSARAVILDNKLRLNDLRRELSMHRTELGRARIDLLQSPAISANNIARMESSLERIEQRIAETQGQDATIAVAPVDGKISALGRRIGQRVSVNMPLVSLLPVSTDYYAELYVPSRAVGFVREGSEIRLRYDAFPYQKYGVFTGSVLRVATSPIRPGEADAPIEVREPSYLLTVLLDDQKIAVNGEVMQLQAGMTLQADIVRERRRIIEWMFDPVASAVKRTQ